MKKVDLFIKDFFAWGIYQKIQLTGNREITLDEIENFAKEVTKVASEKEITIRTHFSRDLTYQFLDEYSDYVSLKNGNCIKSLKLNDEITQENCFDVFNMCVLPNEAIKILSNENVGKTVFKQEKSKAQINNERAL